MPTQLRKLGVHGKNAPTKQQKSVRQAQFNIAGIIGFFERKYAVAMECRDPGEFLEKMGSNVNSSWYGSDVVNSLFNNLGGEEATLWVKSHVGNVAGVIDAVVANATLTDQNGLPSAILLANSLKTVMNAHGADASEHATADTTNFPVSTEDCYDMASLLTLVGSLLTAYDTHEADAELGSGWAYHVAQETGDHSLTSAVAPTTLAEAITRLNDLKAKFNAHDADASAHTVGSQHQESNSDASSTPANTLKFESAYKTILDYGTSGNRTGYKIINGDRYETAIASQVLASATSAVLDSVSGIKVGDIVVFRATGGAGAVISKKITAIDEANATISWSGAFHGSVTGEVDDQVTVPGFKIETYRKDTRGVVTEVEIALGDQWCTMESEVTDYYVQNIHAENRWLKVTDQSSLSTTIETFPGEVQSITYLASGADGTTPTTSGQWALDLSALDSKSVRYIANCETSVTSIQKAGETYCFNREDTPIWIANIPEDQTESQLKTLGSLYQRSGFAFQVNVHGWLEIDDPFNLAPNAPDRSIPNVGAVIGAWIRTVAVYGIHYIPGIVEVSIQGINGVKNDNLGDITDTKRTDIAEYGINLLTFVEGSGYRIRNFFTISTDQAERFANGVLMRNFIKISAEESLAGSENKPNAFNRIRENREAIRNFLYGLWFRGSSGNVPTGETFGQTEDVDGNLSSPEDHFEVQADIVNNPQSGINAGEQNYDVLFTFPTPAGSIEINVGIQLR